MKAGNVEALEEFRSMVREALMKDCPTAMRKPLLSDDDACWGGRNWKFRSDEQEQWLERSVARGWTAPPWPRAYGGAGLSPAECTVLREEMNRAGCRPPLHGWGLSLLGPTLLEYGTEQQKQQHLPAIAHGQIRWCQGFSEPNAGSDLAALSTSAIEQGEHFVVNGQKVWTTYADRADWMFCLVRTDPEAPKHRGISFLLVDMASPGVTVRPMPMISGTMEFCEVFFDDVIVPRENLVGELNRGWGIAKFLLGCEREVAGRLKAQGAKSLGQALGAEGAIDPLSRAEVARFDIEAFGMSCLIEDMAAQLSMGADRAGFGSVMKYIGSELNKTRQELLMSHGGSDALRWAGIGSHVEGGLVARDWLRAKANSIAGGSNEMQLNILSKRVLGLPGGPNAREIDGDTVDFTPVHAELRRSVQGMLVAAHSEAGARAMRERPESFSGELWNSFVEAGLSGMLVPADLGGSGLGAAEVSIVMQELGRTRIPSPYLTRSVLAPTLILRAGSDAQRNALAPRLADSSLSLTLAIDETKKHGKGCETILAEKDGAWVLNGTKTFVPDGASCDEIIVVAREGGETRLVIVERDAPGITVTPQPMVDEQDWAEIRFENVILSDDKLLGGRDDPSDALELALDTGRLAIAGEMLGLGDAVCNATIDYLKVRRQFDHYLSEYQALQHRLALVHTRLELARSTLKAATACFGQDAAKRSAATAAVKHISERAARLAVQEAIQMHGGGAMTDAMDIGFYIKRVQVLSELLGDRRYSERKFAEASGY